MNIIMLDTEMWNYFIEGITGKKSIVCIERIGEVAGIGERSHREEEDSRMAAKDASAFTSTGSSPCRALPNHADTIFKCQVI